MRSDTLDLKSIPKFQFEVNNDGLTQCIKELDFKTKTHDKQFAKMKKDVESKPNFVQLADSYLLIQSCIDIDPVLLKNVVVKEGKNMDNQVSVASHKLGSKMAQMAQVLRILFQRLQNVEKNVETNSTASKTLLNEKTSNIQSQIDDFKKTQLKENRSFNESIQLNLNKYEEKLREVESKTLWQITDCKTKLNDRVNEQYVRDVVKQSEARSINKLKESLGKKHIDPDRIDKLESRCLKLEKDIDYRIIEVNSKMNELKDNVEHSVASKKDLANDKLDTERKLGNLNVTVAEHTRKNNNIDMDLKEIKDDFKNQSEKQEESGKELEKIGKMVANLKISDDFQKLMMNLDPHKICEIDNTLNNLNEKDLKIEKQIEMMKRYQEKLKEKVEICNMLNPTDKNGKLDKEEISRIFAELVTANPTFKKIHSFEGQLYEFKAYGEMINDINKKISKIHKQFDLQTVIYNIRGLEEYIKKELLMMTTKLNIFEGQLEEKKRRPLSARKTSDGKLTSSISYKKLTPVDCISCFQNPMNDRPQSGKPFGNSKY